MSVELNQEELEVYTRFLRNLNKGKDDHQTVKTRVVEAKKFQQELRNMNLLFGTPIVDKLMLMCNVQNDGHVNIEMLIDTVMRGGAKSGSGRASPTVAPDLRGLSQAELVKHLAADIHVMFGKMDTGKLSLDEFRLGLKSMGLKETHETARLLRQTPISFRKLLNSLTKTMNEPRKGFGSERINAHKTRINLFGPQADLWTPKGRVHNGHAEKVMYDSDVVTWTKKQVAKDPRGKKAPGQYHQNFAESHFAIRMDGEEIPPLYNTKVAEMMRETDEHHFETSTQSTYVNGLGQKDKLPITSAGYHTKDRGLLREQIYSCLRNLDSGTFDANQCRQRLENLGVKIGAASEKHFQKHLRTGQMDFNKFARSFEDFLEKSTMHVPLEVPHGSTKRPQTVRRTKGRPDYTPVAAKNHGDIVTWQHTVSNEKEMRHHSAQSFRKKVENAFMDSKTNNLLHWQEHGAAERVKHHKAYIPSPTVMSDPQLLHWTGKEDESSRPERIRNKAQSHIARQHKGRDCPYGTTVDQAKPRLQGIRPVVGSRKMCVGPRNIPTGQWFDPRDRAPVSLHKRFIHEGRAQVDHLGVGFVAEEKLKEHHKKLYGIQQTDHLRGTSAEEVSGEEKYVHQKKLFEEKEYAPDHVKL